MSLLNCDEGREQENGNMTKTRAHVEILIYVLLVPQTLDTLKTRNNLLGRTLLRGSNDTPAKRVGTDSPKG